MFLAINDPTRRTGVVVVDLYLITFSGGNLEYSLEWFYVNMSLGWLEGIASASVCNSWSWSATKLLLYEGAAEGRPLVEGGPGTSASESWLCDGSFGSSLKSVDMIAL